MALLLSLIIVVLIISQSGCEQKDGGGSGNIASAETQPADTSKESEKPAAPTDTSKESEEAPATGEATSDITVLSEPYSREEFYLDTFCRITIYSLGNTAGAEAVVDEAFSECAKYEKELSKTIEESDVYKLNSGKAVECGEHAFNCIADGINYGYFSDGAFNITIGPLTDLWDFHALDPKVPEDSAIKEALNHVYEVSLHNVEDPIVFSGGEVIKLEDPESKIDLGGIAKGYIADRLAEFLVRKGVAGGVIDLGGNIVVIGYKDGTKDSKGKIIGESDVNVGIKLPYTTKGEIVGTVPVHNASIVTSGVYERFFEVDGKRYHHILDPTTGYPADTGIDSITVIGKIGTSEDCDALATVILLKGEEWLKEKLKEEEAPQQDDLLENFIELNEFGFIIIRSDGSIEQLGNPEYIFNKS